MKLFLITTVQWTQFKLFYCAKKPNQLCAARCSSSSEPFLFLGAGDFSFLFSSHVCSSRLSAVCLLAWSLFVSISIPVSTLCWHDLRSSRRISDLAAHTAWQMFAARPWMRSSLPYQQKAFLLLGSESQHHYTASILHCHACTFGRSPRNGWLVPICFSRFSCAWWHWQWTVFCRMMQRK